MHQRTWSIFQNDQLVAEKAVEIILKSSKTAIEKNGRFNLVTAGGTTPNQIYQRLSMLDIDFSNWFIFMGDERVLPADDSERNSVSLKEHWLSKVNIPDNHVFFMKTELGLEDSAKDYRRVIASVDFDLVMLGMGEDGHTASLFPGHESKNIDGLVLEKKSPKPPSERLSLSYQKLSDAKKILKLITGLSKADAVKRWSEGASLPITRVGSEINEIVLLDQASCSYL